MQKRKVEIFTAGCACCEETVQMVQRLACSSCEIEVLNMKEPQVASRAKALGVRSVPAVSVEGKLAGCCAGRGPTEKAIRAAGIGRAA